MKLKRPKFHNIDPGDFERAEALGFDTVELKYDGWWGQLLLEGYKWQIYSRTGQLKKEGTLNQSYGRTLIHGEYIFGTEWATDHPEFYDKFMAHSAEMIIEVPVNTKANRDVSNSLNKVVALLQQNNEQIQHGVFCVQQYPIEHAERLWNYYGNFEGLVFKNSRAAWGAPFGRMKREVTMDYVCLGFETSDSDRHRGWGVASIIGGLKFNNDAEFTKACLVSGLTDDQRRAFFANPAFYTGRVFEANGKKLSKKGALRHPNFSHWREDKAAGDCKWPR